jgi:hypothetical protein
MIRNKFKKCGTLDCSIFSDICVLKLTTTEEVLKANYAKRTIKYEKKGFYKLFTFFL